LSFKILLLAKVPALSEKNDSVFSTEDIVSSDSETGLEAVEVCCNGNVTSLPSFVNPIIPVAMPVNARSDLYPSNFIWPVASTEIPEAIYLPPCDFGTMPSPRGVPLADNTWSNSVTGISAICPVFVRHCIADIRIL
jgi:hypothetical protein